MKDRAKSLKIILMALVALILVRLFFIQIIEHDAWVARAEEEHIVQSTIKAERGEIYMMDGEEPVVEVMNRKVWSIIIDPMLADTDKTRNEVSRVLPNERMVTKWDEIFADKTRRYYVAARNLTKSEADQVRELSLDGVYLQRNNVRAYAEGEMASSLLGFVNADGEGQYGVEGALNEDLSGKDGILKTVTDVNNVALSIGDDNVRIPAENGKNVVLSIDRNIQHAMEKVLKNGMERSHAGHAAGLVMNPQNGEVWALANLPTYDATKYAEVEDASVFINFPLEYAYEPGSMCKTFSFASAIDQGKMTPQTTFTNNGYIMVDNWKIENAYKGLIGTVSMQQGLDYSLNTSSMTALMMLGGDMTSINQRGKDLLYEYYHDRFGFGDYTGIELYESKGNITAPDAADAYNSRYANMTFGQGIDLTMIQVASAFSSVVNGGMYYRPTVVAGEVKSNGEFDYYDSPEALRQTVSAQTSDTMRQMLYGTRLGRRNLGIDKAGYYIGGKTGTSQAIIDGAYSFAETTGNYIGFGSSVGELPEYVIMVKIWGEGLKMEGEKDAMPIFDEMSAYMIDYLKLKPGGNN